MINICTLVITAIIVYFPFRYIIRGIQHKHNLLDYLGLFSYISMLIYLEVYNHRALSRIAIYWAKVIDRILEAL